MRADHNNPDLQIPPDLMPPASGRWPIGRFYIQADIANHPNDQLGWSVASASKLGGTRTHFGRGGTEPIGWAKALVACVAEARRMQAEADRQRAEVQTARQAAIHGNSPTADVDAWIIANMGYTAETLAALGKATRRDRRREARRRM